MYGKRLAELRKEKGYTVYDLAEKVGINGSTYHGYEKSRRKPPLDIIIKIAKFYNVSVDWILGLTDDRNIKILEKDMAEYIKNANINWNGKPLTPEQLKPIQEIMEMIVMERFPEKKNPKTPQKNDRLLTV